MHRGPGDVVPGEGYVVTVTNPDQVLADAGRDELRWLAESLERAAETWRQPVALGEWWDRPVVPFHVVLAGKRIDFGGTTGTHTASGGTPRCVGR